MPDGWLRRRGLVWKWKWRDLRWRDERVVSGESRAVPDRPMLVRAAQKNYGMSETEHGGGLVGKPKYSGESESEAR